MPDFLAEGKVRAAQRSLVQAIAGADGDDRATGAAGEKIDPLSADQAFAAGGDITSWLTTGWGRHGDIAKAIAIGVKIPSEGVG